MQDITQEILELIRLTATDLPPDIEDSLSRALETEEPGSAAKEALETILKNVRLSRENSTPICQDTGTPIFYVSIPESWSQNELRKQIENAVIKATKLSYLRPNSVNPLTGKNTGNNLGDEYYPTIHFKETNEETVTIDLLLKGGGCENVGRQYSLPNIELNAGRDLEGVRKVVLDAVFRAQGKGCAPGVLGVTVGGDRGSSYLASKETLFRRINERSEEPALAKLEETITDQANQLGIGPMGFGGKTTVLDTKITSLHRIPASYFVTISYMCWAYRRRQMLWKDGSATYK